MHNDQSALLSTTVKFNDQSFKQLEDFVMQRSNELSGSLPVCSDMFLANSAVRESTRDPDMGYSSKRRKVGSYDAPKALSTREEWEDEEEYDTSLSSHCGGGTELVSKKRKRNFSDIVDDSSVFENKVLRDGFPGDAKTPVTFTLKELSDMTTKSNRDLADRQFSVMKKYSADYDKIASFYRYDSPEFNSQFEHLKRDYKEDFVRVGLWKNANTKDGLGGYPHVGLFGGYRTLNTLLAGPGSPRGPSSIQAEQTYGWDSMVRDPVDLVSTSPRGSSTTLTLNVIWKMMTIRLHSLVFPTAIMHSNEHIFRVMTIPAAMAHDAGHLTTLNAIQTQGGEFSVSLRTVGLAANFSLRNAIRVPTVIDSMIDTVVNGIATRHAYDIWREAAYIGQNARFVRAIHNGNGGSRVDKFWDFVADSITSSGAHETPQNMQLSVIQRLLRSQFGSAKLDMIVTTNEGQSVELLQGKDVTSALSRQWGVTYVDQVSSMMNIPASWGAVGDFVNKMDHPLRSNPTFGRAFMVRRGAVSFKYMSTSSDTAIVVNPSELLFCSTAYVHTVAPVAKEHVRVPTGESHSGYASNKHSLGQLAAIAENKHEEFSVRQLYSSAGIELDEVAIVRRAYVSFKTAAGVDLKNQETVQAGLNERSRLITKGQFHAGYKRGADMSNIGATGTGAPLPGVIEWVMADETFTDGQIDGEAAPDLKDNEGRKIEWVEKVLDGLHWFNARHVIKVLSESVGIGIPVNLIVFSVYSCRTSHALAVHTAQRGTRTLLDLPANAPTTFEPDIPLTGLALYGTVVSALGASSLTPQANFGIRMDQGAVVFPKNIDSCANWSIENVEMGSDEIIDAPSGRSLRSALTPQGGLFAIPVFTLPSRSHFDASGRAPPCYDQYINQTRQVPHYNGSSLISFLLNLPQRGHTNFGYESIIPRRPGQGEDQQRPEVQTLFSRGSSTSSIVVNGVITDSTEDGFDPLSIRSKGRSGLVHSLKSGIQDFVRPSQSAPFALSRGT